MSADTLYQLTGPLEIQQGEQGGTFGVVNRTGGGQVVTVALLDNAKGQEAVALRNVGDSVSFDLSGMRTVLISADSYPCAILLLATPLDLSVQAAPVVSIAPMPAGATTFHADATITTATTTTLLAAVVGKTAVITGLVISTDTAQRIMLVDGADTAGHRIRGGYFAVGGGLDAEGLNFEQAAPNTAVKVVTGQAGNTFVSIDGYYV